MQFFSVIIEYIVKSLQNHKMSNKQILFTRSVDQLDLYPNRDENNERLDFSNVDCYQEQTRKTENKI